MARESFEDPETAAIMNRDFVNIKVDREERPDLDSIYMAFVSALTSGGWPLSVFLDPHSLGPFTGGTYFPSRPKYGMMSFKQILEKVASIWKEEKKSLTDESKNIARSLSFFVNNSNDEFEPNETLLTNFFDFSDLSYDSIYGGFGKGPKFTVAVVYVGLLAVYKHSGNKKALEMCETSLKKIGESGIYDHLGGGFHRYAVSNDWLVPHFEKMMCDQGMNALIYLDLYQITKDPSYYKIADETLMYVMKKMTHENHGIYSAEDADSEDPYDPSKHGEGAYYVWKKYEIDQLLGETDSEIFCMRFDVKRDGNVDIQHDPHKEFVGRNVLHVSASVKEIAQKLGISEKTVEESLEKSRIILLEQRGKRQPPHVDDKIITEWNGVMIQAYARAFQVIKDNKYLEAANNTIRFIKTELYNKDTGILIRSFRDGANNIHGFAKDYGSLICGLLDTYEAGFDADHLVWAKELQDKMIELFYDVENGGFFQHDALDDTVISRMKDYYDSTDPSSNSYAVRNLFRLFSYTDNQEYIDIAVKTMHTFSSVLKYAPYMTSCVRMYLDKKQIIIAGDMNNPITQKMIEVVHNHYDPAVTLIVANPKTIKTLRSWNHPMFMEGVDLETKEPLAYVCHHFTCNRPVNTPEDLDALLK